MEEDVILHYRPGSSERLSSLLERTEQLLKPFPCRTPPVFTPWFPTTAGDHRLPLRPAKPAPCISSTDVLTVTACQTENKPRGDSGDGLTADVHAETLHENPEKTGDAFCVSETPNNLIPERETTAPEKDVPPIGRSWTIFTQRRVLLRSSQPLSERFRHMVSVQALHLHQRAKWVITKDNCRDIEKVWRSLSRSVRSSRLPTCNANIQRERAEIWVFCDVLHSEQVGRFLKDELQLSGRISLSVRRRGHVFSV